VDALFGDDRADEAGGGDVEHGVSNGDARGDDAAAGVARHLVGRALLDGDARAGVRRGVERGARGGDVERDAERVAGRGDARRADLVGDVAVAGDAVGAPSTITSQGMPSWVSSQAVRRAPCNQGRVSSASTRTRLPAATAPRTTPRAVPKPAVASAPALQWVRITASSGTSAAPWAPIARQAARSSAQIARASSTGSRSEATALAMR
jgi:hypothetical protein